MKLLLTRQKSYYAFIYTESTDFTKEEIISRATTPIIWKISLKKSF